MEPSNPYNIDEARERRNLKWFAVLIVLGFVAAIVLLSIGFALDQLLTPETVEPPFIPATNEATASRTDGECGSFAEVGFIADA
ncbi:MAG: hypothetical protein AMXMBFR84_14290 [Candidatus Hydrogenedentota bacterium]